MSADNGFVIRKNDAGKFVLQSYFASSGYPDIEKGEKQTFDTLARAETAYDVIEDEYIEQGIPIEYGLTVDRSCRE